MARVYLARIRRRPASPTIREAMPRPNKRRPDPAMLRGTTAGEGQDAPSAIFGLVRPDGQTVNGAPRVLR